MKRQAPPFEGIEAFIAGARSPSFRAAAQFLEISPSAFSRRIQTLENFLGRRLFRREAGAPLLSDAGLRYLRDIEPAVDELRRATATLAGFPSSTVVRVAASHSFATEWLAPRLGDFQRRFPALEVQLRITRELDELLLGRIELAITSRPDSPKGLMREHLLDMTVSIVAAPELLAVTGLGDHPDRLAGQRLLGVVDPRDLWAQWAEATGYAGPPLPEPERLQTLALMYEAAAAGLGVAVGVSPLVHRFVADGRLAYCVAPPAVIDGDYAVVWRNSELSAPGAQFMAWIREEAAAYVAPAIALSAI